MPNSRRHQKLLTRIKSLEKNILPNVKTLGNYTKKESDLIRSYALLVHAEIEAYFEDIAEKKVQSVLEQWNSDRKKSNCLLSLMAFCSEEINWDKKPASEKVKLSYRINRVTLHYREKLKNNHGIKEKNLHNILLPLGIELDQIDQAWLNTMNNFGETRGVYAHSTASVQNQIDLVTERNNINNAVLPEVKLLDEKINILK